jgi:hypothetical protein
LVFSRWEACIDVVNDSFLRCYCRCLFLGGLSFQLSATDAAPVDLVQDAECDSVSLMRKIADGVQGAKMPGGCTSPPDGTDGAVVLDATGKVTAMSGIYYTDAAATQATVAMPS